MHRAALAAAVIVLLAVPGAVAAPLPPLDVSVCVPPDNAAALCATCGFIGFRGGFHLDTTLLCL